MSGAYAYNSGYASPQPQSYPPPHNGAIPSYSRPGDPPPGFKKPYAGMDANVMVREVSRTPSPTPSEIQALNAKGGIGSLISRILNYKEWLKVKNIPYIIAGIIGLVLVILFAVYDQQIIHFLQPAADKIKALKGGFLIFVAILFVISFPPLFGHEIVAPVVGLTYGLWPGFGIVCAGTFLGELGNYFAFRACCKARGEKLERENIKYGALAKVVREGGFVVAAIARLSAIPPHFTTAVFSTCGLNFFIFVAAVIVSLPKQFVTVYIGVVLGEEADGTETTKDKRISRIVLIVTIIITIVAAGYINRKIRAATPEVVYARRKRRQAKLEQQGGMYPSSSNAYGGSASTTFNPQVSESELPLTASGQHQRWDSDGRAVGYSGDMNVYDSTSQQGRGRAPAFRSNTGNNSGVSSPAPRRPDNRDSVDSLGWDTQHQGQTLGATQGQDAYGMTAVPIPTIPPPPGSGRQQSLSQAQTQRVDPFASTERMYSPPLTSPGPTRVYSPPSTAPGSAAGRYSQEGSLPTPKYGQPGFSQQQQQQAGRAFSPPPPSYRTGF